MEINFEGLIPILAGVYGLLMVSGKLHVELAWVKERKKLMLVIAPLLIFFGIFQLLSFF